MRKNRKEVRMLKLSASYSKKVPAGLEYSSQSYHACVEVELSDGLTSDELQERIHSTFELVRDSVKNEIHSGSGPEKQERKDSKNGDSESNSEPASPKQIKYLLDLARQKKVNIKNLLAPLNLKDAAGLTRKQCSFLIDSLQGQAPAPTRKCSAFSAPAVQV